MLLMESSKSPKKYVIIEASWGTVDDSPAYNKCHISGATHVDIII